MELAPHNVQERIFAVLVLLFGIILFSSFVSSITDMIIQIRSLRHRVNKRKQALHTYLNQNNISVHLSVRVKKYLEYQMEQGQDQTDESALLEELPRDMLMAILDEARAPVLAACGLLSSIRAEHRRAFQHMTHEATSLLSFKSESLVFCCGEVCSQMLFVERGVLKYRFGGGSKVLDPEARQMGPDLSAELVSSKNTNLSASSAGEASAAQLAAVAARQKTMLKRRAAPSFSWKTKDNNGDSSAKRFDWLCEAALWVTSWHHAGDLRAFTDCTMLVLEPQAFARVMQLYPQAHLVVALYATAFVEMVNMQTQPLSDLGREAMESIQGMRIPSSIPSPL